MDKIDFVITWVDDSDKKWLTDRNKYLNKKANKKKLYRDWDNLKYLFRGIEKFTPWVNKIFFVTYGHLPKWLNVDNEKIIIVNHKDYIPKEYLPTFSSHVIEWNFNKIKNLSEKFVYFNDDTFITDYCSQSYFFKKGLPCDVGAINSVVPNSDDFFYKIMNNNTEIINKYYNKNEVIKKNKLKWFNLKYGKDLLGTLFLMPYHNFVGFKASHMPSSLLKSSLDELWNLEFDKINNTCLNKFRTDKDVNQYLIKNYQIVNGKFYPRKTSTYKFYDVAHLPNNFEKIIKKKKYKMVCINDTHIDDNDFEMIKNRINDVFEKLLPDKSSFER